MPIKPTNSIQVARYILGFSWMYHGLFPKLLTIAPIEQAMTATLGFSDATSTLITQSAGVAEILFGLLIIVLYRNRALIMLNIFALASLLLFVAIQMPTLLFEAFNPVTTNLALIGLSVVLLSNRDTQGVKPKPK